MLTPHGTGKGFPLLGPCLSIFMCQHANDLSAETVVVKADRPSVFVGVKVIATVTKGQQLEVIEKHGKWIGVAWRADDGRLLKGWIRADATSPVPGQIPPAKQDAPRAKTIAGDWPWWRGPTHNGVSSETGIIHAFPASGPKPL